MKEKMKVGIIGAGLRARFQVKAVNESKIGEPFIVYSPFEDEVRNFSEKYNIRHTTSLDEVLENPDLVAITVSTPNATHYQITKKALEKNKKCPC